MSETPLAGRVRSVDLMRGIVCVLMAIDHVRVYSGIPAGGPTPGIFFTRWVTHFVAPGFCFFAGTAAFFLGRRLGDPAALAKFLVTRGLLLVVLELTLLRFAWAFTVDYSQFALAGVIWMLGWCMVLLGALVRLPAKTIGWAGMAIVAFQQLFALVPRALPEAARPGFSTVWEFIYSSGFEGWSRISILYVIVPWIGVMCAGYGFGLLLLRDEANRRRVLPRIGWGMAAAWIVVGSAVALMRGSGGGDDGEGGAPFLIRLLNQQKYPASQLFLLMTLGPIIALLPAAERWRSWWADAFTTIGRVPMFYYVAHLFLIHMLAIAGMLLFKGAFDAAWYATAPYTYFPDEFHWSLPQLYVVFALAIVILYPMCRWYADIKATRPAKWMQYL